MKSMNWMNSIVHCSCWLSHPSGKYDWVNLDDDIPNIGKNKHVPSQQPVHHVLSREFTVKQCIAVLQRLQHILEDCNGTLAVCETMGYIDGSVFCFDGILQNAERFQRS